jgi:recombination protein RecR
MGPLAGALRPRWRDQICSVCGNVDTQSLHGLHRPAARPSIMVVVADVADLWALERARGQRAVLRRHALAARRHRPADLTIDALIKRAHDPAVTEILRSTPPSTGKRPRYTTDLLHDANVKVTRLAHGVPVGGELDYLDGTLAAAIKQRTAF